MRQLQAFGRLEAVRPDMDRIPEAYRDRVSDLFDVWAAVRARNARLTSYYYMKNQLHDLGISIPENMLNVDCVVGWCKKAVDAVVVRSVFDGYAFDGAEDSALSALVHENRMRALVGQAVRSAAIHGVSMLSVMAGRDGQPAAKVRASSANQGAVLWDKDEGRVDCGIVLNDVDGSGRATRYTAHFADRVLDIVRDGDEWSCTPQENPLGRPMMEVLVYDPDLDRPLGHSLLTPEILGIVDKAMRDVLRMEVGAEFFTFPQRYILGAAEDMFSTAASEDGGEGDGGEGEGNVKQAVPNDMAKFMAYIGSIMAITRDENGDVPTVGEFHPSSAENFTAVFENDAQRFSGATNVPLAQLGVLSNNYTSSDALNAANDPLILAVEDMNRGFEEALASVASMMMEVAGYDAPAHAQVVWKDPAMPTIASRADAWTKLGASDPSIVGTRVYYEKVGLDQQTIDRLMREKRANGAIAGVNRLADSLEAMQAARAGGNRAVEP